MSEDNLTDFVFDINANGTVVVRSTDLASARAFLRAGMRDWAASATLRGEGSVADLELLSLGALDDGDYAGRVIVLQHVGDGAQALDMDLTDVDNARICERFDANTHSAGCRVAFAGTPGPCPICAADGSAS